MISSTNLLTSLKLQQVNNTQTSAASSNNATIPVAAEKPKSGLIGAYLNNLAMINIPAVKKAESTAP